MTNMTKQIDLRLCNHDITVTFNDPGSWDGGGMGRADEMAGEILLREGMPNSVECVTFLHEMFHLIFGMHGMSEQNTEEVVSTLATSVFGMLRDNPEVAKTLIKVGSLHKLARRVDE